MSSAKIRKLVTFMDETHSEMGRTISPPTRRAAAVAIIHNPFASRYVDDLEELMVIGEELGDLLGRRCVSLLGIDSVMAPKSVREEAWSRLASDLDQDKLASLTTEIGFDDLIQAATDIVEGKIRGRVVAMM